jgi:prenylcysteine oxidase / farnesylcysteine lyase
VNEIHGVEGTVSMATNRASSILGGNYQVFEQFLKRSGANVFLSNAVSHLIFPSVPLQLISTQVHSITQKPSSHRWTVHSKNGSVDYKAVILAAPFHGSSISLPASLSSSIPPQPYVHLHVTLLTTTSPSPDPEYFGLAAGAKVPNMVLTTWEGVRGGGREPEFNSLNYLGVVRDGEGEEETEWVVKIFSRSRIEDEWLEKVFQGKVGWVYRKEVRILFIICTFYVLTFMEVGRVSGFTTNH